MQLGWLLLRRPDWAKGHPSAKRAGTSQPVGRLREQKCAGREDLLLLCWSWDIHLPPLDISTANSQDELHSLTLLGLQLADGEMWDFLVSAIV